LQERNVATLSVHHIIKNWGSICDLATYKSIEHDNTTRDWRTSQSGDAARVRALAAYKDFLALWKDADPDIPILKQAKAE
jgi:hypothetical protein